MCKSIGEKRVVRLEKMGRVFVWRKKRRKRYYTPSQWTDLKASVASICPAKRYGAGLQGIEAAGQEVSTKPYVRYMCITYSEGVRRMSYTRVRKWYRNLFEEYHSILDASKIPRSPS
jgi:hypothetical protein